MTKYRILGPVEVWEGEERLPVGGPRQLRLLAFLLLHANRAVSSDRIVDAVWNADRRGSDNRLQMATTRLRRALGSPSEGAEPALRTVAGGYLFAVGSGELDADLFAERVSDGRGLLASAQPSNAAAVLSSALDLWRGPPLAELAFEDFAQAEVRRLDDLRLGALEARVEADLQLGRHNELVGELEGLVVEHPLRERFAAQLMLALYRCGRQAQALDVFQRTRTRLAEDLGLEPGPALASLQAEILSHAPTLRADERTLRADAAEFAPPIPATPTIGRGPDTKVVCRLVETPEIRLVTLTGPGGVGKTRLALVTAHALRMAFPDGVHWVELAGVAVPDDVPPTVLRALSVAPSPGETPLEALVRYLAPRASLLVIDNFEHVLDAVWLLSELHRRCQGLTMLVTSREALDLDAEHRFAVWPSNCRL